MSDAAMKVDPDFYNRRLLESDANGLEQSRNASLQGGGGGGGGGPGSMGGSAPIGMMGGERAGGYDGGYVAPDLPDYLVRQHSLLGLYLSLNPTDEGRLSAAACTCRCFKRQEKCNLSASSICRTRTPEGRTRTWSDSVVGPRCNSACLLVTTFSWDRELRI